MLSLHALGSCELYNMFLYCNSHNSFLVLVENSMHPLAFYLALWDFFHPCSTHYPKSNTCLFLEVQQRPNTTLGLAWLNFLLPGFPSRDWLVHIRQHFHLLLKNFWMQRTEFRTDVNACIVAVNAYFNHLWLLLHAFTSWNSTSRDYSVLLTESMVLQLDDRIANQID